MTARHYFHSDDLHLHTQVLRCSPTQDGQYEVILSATLFHPQGGGQPSDLGTIGAAKVLRVMQVGDAIVHFTDGPVALGERMIEVAAAPRRHHAQLHSAGHLLGYCGEQAGWLAVKAHHWPHEARVVFEAIGVSASPTAEAIQAQVNRLIEADLPRQITQVDDRRLVGFGHLPATSCGGTHVVSTGSIGKIKVLKIKEKKGQLSIHYDLEHHD